MEIRTSNVPCSDLSVVWRMTWEEVNYGEYFLDIEMKERQHHKYPFSIHLPLNIALQLYSEIQTVIFAVKAITGNATWSGRVQLQVTNTHVTTCMTSQ